MQLRRERNRILRDLGAEKNLTFRRRMVGKKLSAVTLDPPGLALTSNYLNVELALPEPSNRIIEVEIGGMTEAGLRAVPRGLRVLG
jgi:hypothetical protein